MEVVDISLKTVVITNFYKILNGLIMIANDSLLESLGL